MFEFMVFVLIMAYGLKFIVQRAAANPGVTKSVFHYLWK